MKSGIFICYRRKESAALAGRLYDTLNNWFPENVFIDAENITPGCNFQNQLKTVISQCQVVVALIGPNWESEINDTINRLPGEDYVRSELEQALANNLTIIPVLIDGARMPSLQSLPKSMQALQFQQALEVRTHCFARDIAPLRLALLGAFGLRPPTLWEEFVFRLPGMKTVDERTREAMAAVSLAFALTGIVGIGLRRSFSIYPVIMFIIALSLAMIGKNSKRRRWVAISSIVFAFSGLLVLIYLLA